MSLQRDEWERKKNRGIFVERAQPFFVCVCVCVHVHCVIPIRTIENDELIVLYYGYFHKTFYKIEDSVSRNNRILYAAILTVRSRQQKIEITTKTKLNNKTN